MKDRVSLDRGGFSRRVKKELAAQPLPMRCCRETFLWVAARRRGPPGSFRLAFPAPTALRRMMPPAIKTAQYGVNRRSFVLTAPIEEKTWTRLVFARFGEGPGDCRPGHCLKAALRGFFLRSGYIQDPQAGYHLEIGLSPGRCLALFRLIARHLRIPFRFCRRFGRTTAYLKSAAGIRRFFKRLELYEKLVLFDDLRAVRGMLGHVNRQVNCETANINKSVAASEQISERIRQLLEYPDQEIWSPALRELARVRLEFPHDSLDALGKRFSPPLSKSGVNQRIRRIVALHQKIFPAIPQKEPEESIPES